MASTYLTRTLSSTGDVKKWTFSAWIKLAGTDTMHLMSSFNPSNAGINGYIRIDGGSSPIFKYSDSTSSGGVSYALNGERLFRDPSAWYHVMVSVDTAQTTATDRINFYVNGESMTYTTTNEPALNVSTSFNVSAFKNYIGCNSGADGAFFNGLMANVEFVDGQQYGPAYFGSTDSTTGIWTPQASSTIADYGTNGFKLKMDTTTPGADTSGKSNTFTVGAGTPTLTQGSPSNVYATMNTLFAGDNSAITYSNGNLKTTATSEGQKNAVSTIGVSSGKWYCEMVSRNGNNYPGFGIMDSQSILQTSISYLGSSVDSYCMFQDGNYYTNASAVSTGTTWGVDSIMGISIDLNSATKTIKFYKNGAEEHSATIATPANDYVFAASHNQNGSITEMNFGEGFFGTTAAGTNADANGQGLFAYAVPSGYYALNTKNLEAYG
tara:strand:+ start:23 stop:1333 length:1311 start_codon:yes stop_codon:yes gene_type:complete